jgi:hypothetical protein
MVPGLAMPLLFIVVDLNLPMNPHWTEDDLEALVHSLILTMNTCKIWTLDVFCCTTLRGVIFAG